MESKHTPGPWHVVGQFGEWVNDEHNMNICRVNETVSFGSNLKSRSDGKLSGESNARLIASAPELLEACKMAKVAMAGTDWRVKTILESAIQKAEGSR